MTVVRFCWFNRDVVNLIRHFFSNLFETPNDHWFGDEKGTSCLCLYVAQVANTTRAKSVTLVEKKVSLWGKVDDDQAISSCQSHIDFTCWPCHTRS